MVLVRVLYSCGRLKYSKGVTDYIRIKKFTQSPLVVGLQLSILLKNNTLTLEINKSEPHSLITPSNLILHATFAYKKTV